MAVMTEPPPHRQCTEPRLRTAHAGDHVSRDERTYESNARAPRYARRFVTWSCLLWGVPHLAEDAETVASELVTNAFEHGHGAVIGVRLECSSGVLCMRVWDGNAQGVPVVASPSADDEHHRGLFVAAALADLGVYLAGTGGKVVTAMLPKRPS